MISLNFGDLLKKEKKTVSIWIRCEVPQPKVIIPKKLGSSLIYSRCVTSAFTMQQLSGDSQKSDSM